MTHPITTATAANIITETTGHPCGESTLRYFRERGRVPHARTPSGLVLYERSDVERFARELAEERAARRVRMSA